MTVSLRAFVDDDLDTLFLWESDLRAAWMAAFVRPDPADRAAFDAHYREVGVNPTAVRRSVLEDGHFVGTIGSFTLEGDRELTYWVDPERWGRGIASAAVSLYLEEERERPLFGRCATANIGSRRVLEKSGFRPVGEEISYAPVLDEHVAELIMRLD